jgi:hypothetical protein
MIYVGIISTACFATCAAFRPSWPIAAIYGVLLFGGFFQSLQFMAYNTVCYADIPRPRMSSATSFYTTFQQLCLSIGIATAAASLSGAMVLRGDATPMLPDFTAAFLIVAAIALCAPLVSRRLDVDAGAELTGQKRAIPAAPVSPPPPAAVPPTDTRPVSRRPTAALLERSTPATRRRGRAG